MKKLLALSSLALTLLTGCSSSSASMPDTFWGLMSWHYTSKEDGAYGVTGSVQVKMLFTRTEDNKYEITGTVEPNETACTQYNYLPEPCDPIWCEVKSTDAGTLKGFATVENGVLSATPLWDEEYTIHIENMCDAMPDDPGKQVFPGQHEATIMESLYPTEEDPFFYPWTIDVDGITFIDELPVNEMTDAKTGFKNFSATGLYSTGEGLLGLYRNEPQ